MGSGKFGFFLPQGDLRNEATDQGKSHSHGGSFPIPRNFRNFENNNIIQIYVISPDKFLSLISAWDFCLNFNDSTIIYISNIYII